MTTPMTNVPLSEDDLVTIQDALSDRLENLAILDTNDAEDTCYFTDETAIAQDLYDRISKAVTTMRPAFYIVEEVSRFRVLARDEDEAKRIATHRETYHNSTCFPLGTFDRTAFKENA